MRLAEVNIQAYRSLYDVTLQPRDFTVLVGPNNAGKTNLADALDFLGQIARNGLEVAVGRAGGFENLAFRRRRRTRRPVRFAFRAEIPQADVARAYHQTSTDAGHGVLLVDYSFELRANSESRDADFRVSSERLDLFLPDDPKPAVSLRREADELSITTARAQ
jgi:predicted ATPase